MQYRLTPGQLDRYFARIGFDAPPRADLATLRAVHRAHAYAFTWENLDAFMGWSSSVDPAAAFDKMVEGRRGGWCYEMNGLLGAALAGIGFSVTRLCGGVRRDELGERAVGNHLTLRIDLDRPYLADTGLGDAQLEPIALAVGAYEQDGLRFAIEPADGEWLRFRNHPAGGAPTFDFRAGYSDETALADRQAWLLTDPNSPFANMLILQRHFPGRIEALRNTTRLTLNGGGLVEMPIENAEDFAALLTDVFQVRVADAGAVWAKAAKQ